MHVVSLLHQQDESFALKNAEPLPRQLPPSDMKFEYV